jgi:hypothetical protein
MNDQERENLFKFDNGKVLEALERAVRKNHAEIFIKTLNNTFSESQTTSLIKLLSDYEKFLSDYEKSIELNDEDINQ